MGGGARFGGAVLQLCGNPICPTCLTDTGPLIANVLPSVLSEIFKDSFFAIYIDFYLSFF